MCVPGPLLGIEAIELAITANAQIYKFNKGGSYEPNELPLDPPLHSMVNQVLGLCIYFYACLCVNAKK